MNRNNYLINFMTQKYVCVCCSVFADGCLIVPQQHICHFLGPFQFRAERHFSLPCFGMRGCFSICQQRVRDTVRNIPLSCANITFQWNRASLGGNESQVMCCFFACV